MFFVLHKVLPTGQWYKYMDCDSVFGWSVDTAENPYGEDDSKSPFPIQPKNKRSYGQNVTVWIKASGLQVLTYRHPTICNDSD